MKIGFVVREYIGRPVYKDLDAEGNPIPLIRREDLQEGDIVYAWGGQMQFRIARGEHGHLQGGDGSRTIFLNFAEDDRKCWIAVGVANLKALKKLDIYKE